MSGLPAFPGETVISSFGQVESMFADVLRHIPYVPGHEGVWSPALATVLLEAGSQLDSFWKHEAAITPNCVRRASETIKHHFQNFAQRVALEWAVLWDGGGVRLDPFAKWAGLPDYSEQAYVSLDWWQAYNAVKHDRLANREQATVKHAAHALAALLIAIVKSPPMLHYLAAAGWVKRQVGTTSALLLQAQPAELKAVETRCFSYLLEIDRKDFSGTIQQEVGTHGSYRFYLWMKANNRDPKLKYE